jgi:hypothetical protein
MSAKPWIGPRTRTRAEHLSGKTLFRPTWVNEQKEASMALKNLDGLDPLRETLEHGITELTKLRAKWNTLECAGTHDEDARCAKCCDHTDMDERTCLECGADMSEELAARAEWAAECAGGE